MTYVRELGCFVNGIEDLASEIGGDIETVINEEIKGVQDVAKATITIVDSLIEKLHESHKNDVQAIIEDETIRELHRIKHNLMILA